MQLTMAHARGKDMQGFTVPVAFLGSVVYSRRQHLYLTNSVVKYFVLTISAAFLFGVLL